MFGLIMMKQLAVAVLMGSTYTVNGANYDTGLPSSDPNSGLTTILQITFGIIGAIAVLMIIISGFRFTTAQGNPQSAAKARRTILFAAIGLFVALSAEAIVTFVLGRL